jgi:hypothetical protein
MHYSTQPILEDTQMAIPIFAVAAPCFFGIIEEEDRNPHISELEYLAGFDICEFIAGDFLDKRQQPAQLLLGDGTLVDCQILMATSDKGNKFAFLISSTSVNMEENRAWHSLYVDGEWMKHGKEI